MNEHVLAHVTSVGALKVYVVDGFSALVATAWTALGAICCHFIDRAGLEVSGGSDVALVGALKRRRSSGRFGASEVGAVADTRYVVPADAASDGARIVQIIEVVSAQATPKRRFTPLGYRGLLYPRLTIALRKRWHMSMIKTVGVVVVILLALWLVFKIIGILTAILSSVIVVLIVAAVCYGVYHHFSHQHH